MRIFSIALIFILTLGFSQSQQAVAQSSTELKIGYVNPQSILANMPEMRAVQQRLQNFTARKQQELTTLEQQFQSQVAEYQQKNWSYFTRCTTTGRSQTRTTSARINSSARNCRTRISPT